MATRSKVKVLGTTYYITTSGSEEQMRHIEEQLNDQLTGILEQRPSLSTLDAVVILCLNLMDQLTETESSTDRMREQLSQYLEDILRGEFQDRQRVDVARCEQAALGQRALHRSRGHVRMLMVGRCRPGQYLAQYAAVRHALPLYPAPQLAAFRSYFRHIVP